MAQVPPPGGGTASDPSAMQFTAAWLLFILLLFFLAKTHIGKTLLYYLMWSLCLLLIVSHYQDIAGLFQAGGITS